MTLEELRKEVPEMENYLKYMPKELEQRYWIRVYEPGVIIHQKDYELECFGIIAKGEHRVINEFQNGNVFMIGGPHDCLQALPFLLQPRRKAFLSAAVYSAGLCPAGCGHGEN